MLIFLPLSQILCWGVRDMKRYQLLKVTSPMVELECGGTVVRSEPIKDTEENPNFPKPVISFDVVSDSQYLVFQLLQYLGLTCLFHTSTYFVM